MTFGSTMASEVRLVDLEDAVHPLQREHDAALHRHGAAGVAGAGAARHERHAVRVAEPRDRRHLCAVSGNDDDIGGLPRLSASVP